jgi:arginine deiminase
MSVYLDSEIGRLKRVIVHSPGTEIERMTPESARQLLYHDIIPISVVSREHEKLKSFLSQVAEVYEMKDLVSSVINTTGEAKAAVVRAISSDDRAGELIRMGVEELTDTLIGGLPARRHTLTDYLSERLYDIPPLPNLYFMRDGAMVFRDRALVGAMAHRVRVNESLLLKAAFSYVPQLGSEGILFDGVLEGGGDVRLEGGDFMPVSPNTLILGVSERSSAEAVDRLAQNLVDTFAEPFHILVVMLPHEPSTIHLDMVFTLVDRHAALVYAPYVLGSKRLRVVRMDVAPGEETVIRDVAGIIEGLAELGVELEPILCGGESEVYQQREQWMSGTNVLAFAPGKVIGYDCNVATAEAFAASGFTVRPVDVFLSGEEHVDDHERLLVLTPGVELARGGGGARCMTLPVEREPVG